MTKAKRNHYLILRTIDQLCLSWPNNAIPFTRQCTLKLLLTTVATYSIELCTPWHSDVSGVLTDALCHQSWHCTRFIHLDKCELQNAHNSLTMDLALCQDCTLGQVWVVACTQLNVTLALCQFCTLWPVWAVACTHLTQCDLGTVPGLDTMPRVKCCMHTAHSM